MNDSPGIPRAVRRRQWLEVVDAAVRRGDMASASQVAERALADGVEHAEVLNLVAFARHGQQRFDEAITLLKRARALEPRNPHVLNGLGLCLRDQGRFDAALEAFDAAIRAQPRYAAAHFNKGALLEERGDIAGARAGYLQAVSLQPDYTEALAGLAWLAAQSGDAAKARDYGLRPAALPGSYIRTRMALALADLHERDYAAAEPRLSALAQDAAIGAVDRAIVLGLIGDLRDGQDRPAEAFAAYQDCKATLKQIFAPRFEGPGVVPMSSRVRRLADYFRSASAEPWRAAPVPRPRAADPAAHVFLVGFPRSGTTLLENVLAAHPAVVTLEERDGLGPAIADLLYTDEGLARLARIGADEALRRREDYWRRVRAFGVEPRGRVFIDKMPLASLNLPLIAKLFPNARILFALRDPRDVVLSCFRRRFGMNSSMYELLTLDGAAGFYAAVMELYGLYRDTLPLEPHVVRCEALVEDFEATAEAVCAYLGLGPDPSLRDFASKARERPINTPSAAQVARGLNRDGIGTWRRYRRQLEPVLPRLTPWVERFGYPPD